MAKTNRPLTVLVDQEYSSCAAVQELILKQNDVRFISADDEIDLILSRRAWRVVPGMEDMTITEAVKVTRRTKYGKESA